MAEINEAGTYSLVWSDGRHEELKAEKAGQQIDLSSGWTILFGDEGEIRADQLKSWTEFDLPRLKYYSGNAIYNKTFELSSDELNGNRLVLDLGNVKEMASVKINGKKLQVMWSAPFRFDLTPYLKAGVNNLNVEVVNMWVNRLIGDGKLPENERVTKTNINKFDAPDAEKYLRVSGIDGTCKTDDG